MNLLTADGLRKVYGAGTVFESVSFGIDDGDKIGLIGINGTGKSTLLRIIAGIEEADEGIVTKRNGLKISYLPQDPVFDDSISLVENVILNKRAEEEYRNLRGEAYSQLIKMGISDPECRPSILSGGQRKRAALISALLIPSDLLILDEPTNHLDTEMIEWLEEKLKSFKGAILFVTHDRYFLDEVANRIFEIDKRALYTYVTNYSGFVELKSEREASELATERKAKSLFRSELAWMLRGARARSTKQKAHIERFKALRDRKKIETVATAQLFSASSRLGKKTLEAASLSKSFDKCVINDFSYIFLQNDRIGIIGRNGCGKSTLLKLLTGRISPDGGRVDFGSTVRFGYFAQECAEMDPSERVIDYIKDAAEVIHTKEGDLTAARMCERFLFTSDMQYTLIGKLSGGERRRLYLLRVLMEAPNILLLDEPTNDLDIMTLTILEDYLASFEGIIIAVSHDRYFLDKVVNRLFVFRENGLIEQVEGNYTDYLDKELERAEAGSGEALRTRSNKRSQVDDKSDKTDKTDKLDKPDKSDKSDKPLKLSYNEQREYASIDDDISALESAISKLDEDIAAAGSDYMRLEELLQAKREKENELEQKMERWVYLNELVERINNSKSVKK